ncbi:MAG TPA: hypothetical protein VN634_10040 [Candidatus Limnocylindrales bacterium]|nr:hypothetical protein [Candidatus Limnocylindrales bacterium]
MHPAKKLVIELGGVEDAPRTFARDQLAALRSADDGCARVRVWRRDEAGILLGRFHRADAAACAAGLVSRRLSGGRIVPVGPGTACVTLVVPVVDWLDPTSASLRPDQILNRALRPLLSMLRDRGVDAFYGGRDLITVNGRTVAHASFTVMRDGIGIIEMHMADRATFRDLAALLDRCDPAGVAGVDRDGFATATSVAELLGANASAWTDDGWAQAFAGFAATSFSCEVATAADSDADVTMADVDAAHGFFQSPGPVAVDRRTAAEVAMLGVVECAGSLRGDRLTALEITGDLIAPFHTLDDIAAECEGEPLRPASIRKALARALARPRSFVLGIRELDQLVLRLASG